MSETLTADSTVSHYRIVSKLGSGGMGEVYLAQDTRLRRKVALKVLPADVTDNRERLHRFTQEAQAASALNHPNILTVHEIGEQGGTHFIAAEFVEGETLRQRLQPARLEIREAVDIAAQIAAALDAAHRGGIVHRDLKPENVMVRGDGLVKVLDFGLAKLTGTKEGTPADSQAPTRAQVRTSPGVIMGTISYMSPEQARGKEVDARTDVFSLGVVLYEMLAGRPPFAGETASDVLAGILKSEPAPLDEDTPAELRRIVRKCLRKGADERYQTAKDLLLDLKALQREQDFAAGLERSGIPTRGDQPAPTTVLDGRRATGDTRAVSKPKSRRRVVLAVAALAVLTLAAAASYFSRWDGTAVKSIAVLPFENRSSDPDAEYLSDGLAESLIYRLSQLPNLKVSPTSSAFRYKGKATDPLKVGEELGVQAVMSGRVSQRGDSLAISVELVDVRNDKLLWGEQYDRKMSELMATQREIAAEITSKLRVKLSGADERRLAKNYTANPEAYKLYLQGRFYWNKSTPDNNRKAIEYFSQAIAVDPNYAMAYAGIADAYPLLSLREPRQVMPKAREAALKALSLDNDSAEAHVALGRVLLEYDYDFAAAERELKRAAELNPDYALGHSLYGTLFSRLGRHEEAFAEYRRALELEPLSLRINRGYGEALFHARRYDEAIAQLKKTVELDASFLSAHISLRFAYQMKGNFAESIEEHIKAAEVQGNHQRMAWARDSFARGGWEGFLRDATRSHRDATGSAYITATLHAALGEKDEAFAELNKSYGNREYHMTLLKVDPRLDPLRADPRFADLMRKVGFPQ